MVNVRIEESWKTLLANEFASDYFYELTNFVRAEYGSGKKIYPAGKNIFNAFNRCPVNKVKVVILGQDPYHEEGQAHGLCFSVPQGITPPPSLVNIFKEIKEDLGKEIPQSGNLERWADQGVLLLNATLTVEAHKAGSHQKRGWERFTDAVIKNLVAKRTNLVFMLWGAYAQKKGAFIDTSQNLVLKSVHPSPLSANRGGWFGNHHFSKANDYLKSLGKEPIDW